MNEDMFNTNPDNIFCKSSPIWSDDDYLPGSPMEVQHYQQKINELQTQLQEAKKEIGELKSQVAKQEQSPKTQSRYWTNEEHNLFLEAINLYGAKDVKAIANHVGTRSTTQVRTHSQKYFLRLERERKKEEERKKLEKTHFEQDQFEKFLSAVRFTSHVKDYDKKIELIHQNHMPDTSKETITSWFFIHIKTIEKIQDEEANKAANSVGVKRQRACSNPTHINAYPRNIITNRFTKASIPTSSLAQSSYVPQKYISNSPQYSYFSPNEYKTVPPGFFKRFDKPRPNSEPNFATSPNNYQNGFSNFTPPQSNLLYPSNMNTEYQFISQNINVTPNSNNDIMQDIKPYVPGAPPPSSPAPPPPLFNDHFSS